MTLTAEDGMRLACARLSICQKGGIVALEDRLDEVGRPFIDISLFSRVVDLVETEDLLLIIFAFDGDGGGVVLGEREILRGCPPYRPRGSSTRPP